MELIFDFESGQTHSGTPILTGRGPNLRLRQSLPILIKIYANTKPNYIILLQMNTISVTSVPTPGWAVLIFSAITNLMSRLCFAVSKPLSEKFAQLLKPKKSRHYIPEIVTMAMLEATFEIQSFNAYAALDILQENRNELEDES